MTSRFLTAAACIGLAMLPSAAPAGTLAVLHAFTGGADGANPYGWNEAIDASGTVYGLTLYGGASCPVGGTPLAVGCGTVWKVDASGTFSTVVTFGGDTGGATPYGLVLVDGRLYGTTRSGGAHSTGTLFSVRTDGTHYAVLHDFASNETVNGIPALDTAGNIYVRVVDPTTMGASVLKLTHSGSAQGASGYTAATIYSFPAGVAISRQILVQPGGKLVLLAWAGCTTGTLNCGQIVTVNQDGTGFTQLLDVSTSTAGNEPQIAHLHGNGFTLYSIAGGGTDNVGAISAFDLRHNKLTVQHVFTKEELRDANPPVFDPAGNLWDSSFYGALDESSPDRAIGTIFNLSGKPPVLNIPVLIDFNGSSTLESSVYGGYAESGPVWSRARAALVGTFVNSGPSTGGAGMGCTRPDGTSISAYGCGTVFSYTP